MSDIIEESWYYQEILAKGLAQGVKQGVEQGVKQGVEQGQREMITHFVEKRFPELVPLVAKRVVKEKGIVALQTLYDQLLDAQSPEEARKVLVEFNA